MTRFYDSCCGIRRLGLVGWGIRSPLDFSSVGGFLIYSSSYRPRLVVALAVVVLILQEEVLVCAVGSESDRCDAQAGEEALEPVPPGEGASVAPSLTK